MNQHELLWIERVTTIHLQNFFAQLKLIHLSENAGERNGLSAGNTSKAEGWHFPTRLCLDGSRKAAPARRIGWSCIACVRKCTRIYIRGSASGGLQGWQGRSRQRQRPSVLA